MNPTFLPQPIIQKTRDPKFPQFVFEWHEQTGKVWVIGLPGKFIDREFVPAISGQARGFIATEHCDTHARFLGFVQTYLRGYRQGTADEKLLAKGEANVVLGYPDGGPKTVPIENVKGAFNG
jgi:hypothetical protein